MNTWRFVTGLSFVMLLGACTIPQPKQQTLDPEANYWQQVGSSVATGSSASLALDEATGYPVVAYDDSSNIYVKRWNGSNWVQLGGILDVNTNSSFDPSLALDSSSNPVVSWWEFDFDGNSYNIYVKRWDGSSWVQLGTFLDANTNQNAFNPSLALDSAGNPVVSWSESDGISENIYVKRWNGSSWVNVGSGVLSASSASRYPCLSFFIGLRQFWKSGSGVV